MRKITIAALLAGTLLSLPVACVSSAWAQDANDQDLAEFLDLFDRVVNQVVNAATLFSSQDSISSGYFRLKSDEDPDEKLDILKVPIRVSLSEDSDAEIRPFVLGHFGTLKDRESIQMDSTATGENDFSVIESWTLQGGGGVDILLFEGLTLTPQFSLAYTRLEHRYDYNNSVSQEFEPFVDGEVFNWNIDTITYAPRIGVSYELPFELVSLKLLSHYTYLYNDSFHSSSSLIDVSSDTSMFQNGIKARFPLGVQLLNGEVALDPFVLRSDVQGAARDGLGFDHFYEGGVDIALGTSESLGFVSEVTAGTSYTWTDDFEGLRIGFGATF